MKKYILLSSILALTACHSGGGSHSGSTAPNLVTPELDMPTSLQSWNKGFESTHVAYTGRAGNQDNFIFTVDNKGNISSVTLDGDKYVRTGDNNEYVYTEANKTSEINLATFGKEIGLQYADFGYAMETELKPNSTDRDFYVFTGGKNPMTNPDVKNMTFTGAAVAYVEAKTPNTIANQISKTSDAKLVVDANGNRRLDMNFSKADNPWYDVVVTGNKIELQNGANVASEFQVTNTMIQDSPYVVEQFYGANNVATDATYRVGAEYEDKATGREVEFDAAFGGVR